MVVLLMKQHKWMNEIIAWAEGHEIQQADIRSIANPVWYDADNPPNWESTFYQYRIKPQPKKQQYLYVYHGKKSDNEIGIWLEKQQVPYIENGYIGKIKIEQE